MIVGRLIPAGTGLAYHSARRRNAGGLTDSEMQTLSGVQLAAEEVTATAVAADADAGQVQGSEE